MAFIASATVSSTHPSSMGAFLSCDAHLMTGGATGHDTHRVVHRSNRAGQLVAWANVAHPVPMRRPPCTAERDELVAAPKRTRCGRWPSAAAKAQLGGRPAVVKSAAGVNAELPEKLGRVLQRDVRALVRRNELHFRPRTRTRGRSVLPHARGPHRVRGGAHRAARSAGPRIDRVRHRSWTRRHRNARAMATAEMIDEIVDRHARMRG